ncbi:hypothetical protein EZS27_043427, partial [termite gut metagenome]
DDSIKHATVPDPLYAPHKKEWLKLYTPARTAVIVKKI